MNCLPDIDDCVQAFLHTLSGNRIIVGLSGGADSVALLSALTAAGAQCIAAHCNFGLRGDESERDMAHAEAVAASLSAEYISVRFDVPAYMAGHRCSLETACRELRYKWFEDMRLAHRADWIAVAHHRDDNNETLLLNLFRGTSISGLRGMKPVNGKVIRPLLKFSRTDIEHYLADKNLSFITDSSNLVSDVSRNKIRNIIMPYITDSFPNAAATIALTADNLYSTDEFITEMIDNERALWTDADGNINVAELAASRRNVSFILYSILKDEGFTPTQVSDILNAAAECSSGKIFIAKDGTKRVLNRGVLEKCHDDEDVIPDFTVDIVSRSEFAPGTDRFVEFFATDILSGTPLTLRRWMPGDRMKPFGMKGSRLISDILSDAKVSVSQKEHIRLLVKDDEILWLPGLRRSGAYPVTPSDTRIVRIQFMPARRHK
jgi:tRNA(Ile)-lysidine synthase